MPAKRFSDSNIHNMLQSRMGWNMDDPKCPLNTWKVALLSEGNIVVFVVMGNRYATVEDDAALYPSDQLITQLRMWIGNGGNPQG